MTDKRIVKGLLDVMDAEAAGEEWDFQPGWEGLTEEQTAFYILGKRHAKLENLAEYDLKPKPARRGRPQKDVHSDAVKAFACWQMLWGIRNALGKPSGTVEILELIRVIRNIEDEQGVPPGERLFRKETTDRSHAEAVNRGKRKLGIDRGWNSVKCDEILDRIERQ
jgi:hypothetical protein